MTWPAGFAADHPWFVATANQVCTPRQLEVLQARAKHLTFREIADGLGITRQAAHETYFRATIRVANTQAASLKPQEPA